MVMIANGSGGSASCTVSRKGKEQKPDNNKKNTDALTASGGGSRVIAGYMGSLVCGRGGR